MTSFLVQNSYPVQIPMFAPGHQLVKAYSEGDRLIQQAQALSDQGYRDQATEVCLELLQKEQNGIVKAQTNLFIATNYFLKSSLEECIQFASAACELDPQLGEAYYVLGKAFKLKGMLYEAKSNLSIALQLLPGRACVCLSLAYVCRRLQDYDEAIKLYLEMIRLYPDLEEAYKSLGYVYLELKQHHECISLWRQYTFRKRSMGDYTKAIEMMKEILAKDSSNEDNYLMYGDILMEIGQSQGAFKLYIEGSRLATTRAKLYFRIGSLHSEWGSNDLALENFLVTVELDPSNIDALNCSGNCYRIKQDYKKAIEFFRKAIEVNPSLAQLHNNMGNCFLDNNMFDDAKRCYEVALSLDPTLSPAHCNIASVFKYEENLELALHHNQEAIRLNPLFADAFCNMGNIFKDLGKMTEAMTCYQKALEINPCFDLALANLGNVFKDTGKSKEAIDCYNKALLINPNLWDTYSNLVNCLIIICNWNYREENMTKLTEIVKVQMSNGQLPSVQPFHAFVYPMKAELKLDLAIQYAKKAKETAFKGLSHDFQFHFPREKFGKKGKINIGYVSSDFGDHPLCHLMMSVFGFHNKERFNVSLFAISPDDGSVFRRKVMSECTKFVDLSAVRSTSEQATIIHKHDIDVLINLNGYTKGSRNEIFALRPAPVQISYMGFCASMGADYIDYMVCDKTVIPEECQHLYTEKIIYMPHSYFVNDYKQSVQFILEEKSRLHRRDFGLPEDKFIFANFNQLYKIDPDTFRTWCQILKKVENSCLWLLKFPELGEANIRSEAAKNGISQDRIIFTDVARKDIHIQRSFLADLFLDTPLCNAHTTGCDVLWSGLPMVSLPLDQMASRVAAGLIHAIECPEMLVGSLQEYEEEAVDLALGYRGTLEELAELPPSIRNLHGSLRLKRLRRKIMDNRLTTPLFDTSGWVKNFEVGILEAWNRRCQNKKPEHIEIAEFTTQNDSN